VLHSRPALGAIALEAPTRPPRKDVPIVAYDAAEGLVPQAADRLRALGDAPGTPSDTGSISGKNMLFQDPDCRAKLDPDFAG
jgi:hypothetical protein